MKAKTYCGSAYCKEKHEWHESGEFLKARNCGSQRIRTPAELQEADDRLAAWNKKFKEIENNDNH